MKFLDKETGTLGERIRTLFKEQGITIVSILTARGMTLGVLIEALLGGPSTTSTPTSQSTTTSDKKGGAREWIKNKLKALSQLLGKLADKNNKKRSHTQLDSRKQVIAFQDRVITINIKEAQHYY